MSGIFFRIFNTWQYNLLTMNELDLSDNAIGPELNAINLAFQQNNISVFLSGNLIKRINFKYVISLGGQHIDDHIPEERR